MKRTLAFFVTGAVVLAACSSAPAATTAPTAVPATATAAPSVAPSSAAPSAAPSSAAPSSGAPSPSASGSASAAPSGGTGEKDIITLKSGTGVVEGHPFFAMVAEYNRTHPDVEVRLDIAPWSGDIWAALGTGLAAGNPPDVMRVSIGGIAGQGALQSPLLVDVKPYLSPDEIADYGKDILAPIDINGKYVIWPQDRDWGTSIVANGTKLQDAGIDVAKIQADGWTFDEFRDAAKKLTKGDTFGFGYSADYAPGAFLELAWRAGCPDGNANNGAYFWGNKFDLTGACAVKAAQLMHDMIYVDKSTPAEVTGLKEHMPLLWSGKVAMINYYHGAVGEIKAYNASIDAGTTKGAKADFNVVLLPWPHDVNGPNVNIARTTGLAIFKQDPYKGDAHMQHVIDFVRYLTSPINLATFANWEGTIPAKTSAFPYSTQINEPQIKWWAGWASAHAVAAFPYGHPAYGQVASDAMGPGLTDVLNDAKTPEQAVADWTPASQAIIDKWAKDNPGQAAQWATPPAGWPESYMTPLGK